MSSSSNPVNILIAPDSFKGSLSAIQFCEIAQKVILQQMPKAKVWSTPLSDGGEGFIDSLLYNNLAQPISVTTQDPLHRPIQAQFAWQPAHKTAFIEMAQASGITLLKPQERNPLNTSTYGTGIMIQKAIQMGATKIIIGLGGSATHDGAAGALQALGVPFYNQAGERIDFRQTGAAGLLQLHHIGTIPQSLKTLDWILAADVTTPLLGKQGATAIFAPQKGASPQTLPILEAGLGILAQKIEQILQKQIHHLAGSGAAGGFAAGFIGLLNAQLHPGFEVLKEALQLTKLIKKHPIQLMITGEGKIDNQTLMGKLPYRVAKWFKTASSLTAPQTIGLCGQLAVQSLPYFDALYTIHQTDTQNNWHQLVAQTPSRLEQTLHKVIHSYIISNKLPKS